MKVREGQKQFQKRCSTHRKGEIHLVLQREYIERAANVYTCSATQGIRDDAAIAGELVHNRPMQRDVLLRCAIRSDMDVQFLPKLFACGETGVEVEKLEKINDGRAVIAAMVRLHRGHGF
ncbi:hypothetical protein BES08_26020 (plasmid) [Novosphingobium resinovorum]|uniref:Uncharacterized protein n=1 Tax=Novosphingobium resinovorum TaxID=158500 RepID=A0A1D8ADZ9_9SPHN|nr:hypothetical protein BES08_26020 [Novosphingobium resinovorum]